MLTQNLHMRIALFVSLAGFLFLASCRGPEVDPNAAFLEQLKIDTTNIGVFVRANGLNTLKTASGLQILVTRVGTGRPPRGDSDVEVTYTGKLLTGEIFDSGNIDGNIAGFIPGFSAGLQLLPVGSSAVLLIPSVYAYGASGSGSIPPNASLAFTVTLDKVNTSQSYLSQLYSDTTKVYEHLDVNNITGTVKDPSGLRYKITSFGTGANANWYDRVKVKYTARLMTTGETVIIGESEPTQTFDSWVINYMPVFQVGLRRISPGGSITLYTPSGLAYGTQVITTGKKTLPPNSNLIYEVELIEILPQ